MRNPITLRPGRPGDKEAIEAFTTGTFEWGDYIARVYDDWLTDPHGKVTVAADALDQPVGLARSTLVSATEAWVQGIRIHPDHRRQGIAARITDDLCTWAAQRGARVARLLVEDWNEPSRALAGQCGFRAVGEWIVADREIGSASPVPEGNGGKRTPAPERLERAPSSEAEPAYIAWSGGDIARAARDLMAVGWTWRRLHPGDLVEAGRNGALWQARSGWVMAGAAGSTLRAGWLHTSPEDADVLARALVDHALHGGLEHLEVMMPSLDWLGRAFRRAGADLWSFVLFARAL